MRVDHMTIEILCADLRDVWAKFVGVTERNVFCKNRPHGGAILGLSRKCGAEVHCWHPRSVCAQFRSNRTSGAGDKLFTDKLKHRPLILQTLEANLSQSGWNMQDWTYAC